MTNALDMSAFEEQFADIQMSPFMDNEMFAQLSNIRDQIHDLQEMIPFREETIGFVSGEAAKFARIVKSMQEVIDTARKEMRPLLDEIEALNKQNKYDQAQLDALSRQYFRMLAEIEDRKRLMAESQAISDLTMGAKWREFALPHQIEGAKRLTASRRAILGDGMGLGKTLQAIMTFDMLKAVGAAKKCLILCPKPVLDNFEYHFQEYSPNNMIHVLNEKGRAQGKSNKSTMLEFLAYVPEGVLITNYEFARKEKALIEKVKDCMFDTVILDEAHVVRNTNRATSKMVTDIVMALNKCNHCGRRVRDRLHCISCGAKADKIEDFRSVKNVFPLTGTSVINTPLDIFALVHLVDPRGFPNETGFLRDFCRQVCVNCKLVARRCVCTDTRELRWFFQEGGEKRLLSKLGMKYTARTRDSANVIMPPQKVQHHWLEMNDSAYEDYPEQMAFIEELREDAVLRFADTEVTGIETLEWYLRMRQAVVWPNGIDFKIKDEDGNVIKHVKPEFTTGSIVMDEAMDVITEAVDSKLRVVAFSRFKPALKEAERRLAKAGISVVRYDGDLPDSKRLEAQHDFDLKLTRPEDSKFKVMLAHYDSAKVGLNLHGAHVVVFLDREWSPSMEQQAMDRVRRIGSEHETMVHIFHLADSITDRIDALIEQKRQMRDGFTEEVNIREEFMKYLRKEN